VVRTWLRNPHPEEAPQGPSRKPALSLSKGTRISGHERARRVLRAEPASMGEARLRRRAHRASKDARFSTGYLRAIDSLKASEVLASMRRRLRLRAEIDGAAGWGEGPHIVREMGDCLWRPRSGIVYGVPVTP
jgi:hypothetical protein